jgi:hypothetical protein
VGEKVGVNVKVGIRVTVGVGVRVGVKVGVGGVYPFSFLSSWSLVANKFFIAMTVGSFGEW